MISASALSVQLGRHISDLGAKTTRPFCDDGNSAISASVDVLAVVLGLRFAFQQLRSPGRIVLEAEAEEILCCRICSQCLLEHTQYQTVGEGFV